jgi:primosomal protein N' (replication factor Y)
MQPRDKSTPDLFADVGNHGEPGHAPTVARVVIPTTVDRPFDYAVPPDLDGALRPGRRVVVPFGRRTLTGFVLDLREASEVAPGRLRWILALAPEPAPLPPAVLALCLWAARYYQAPIAEVLKAALPPATGGVGDGVPTRQWVVPDAGAVVPQDLTRRRHDLWHALCDLGPVPVAEAVAALGTTRPMLLALAATGLVRLEERPFLAGLETTGAGEDRVHTLTADQATALAALRTALRSPHPRPHLLHGVTGSGKTEVYLRLAEEVIAAGRQVLVLVPEIGLTPQVAGQFLARFGARVAVQHSGLSVGQRRAQWQQIAEGRVAVVVGTRSAVFAPLPAVGLIVVDEEHDTAYKQEESPRYNGRDLALARGQQCGALVVLGSATPSFEVLHGAATGRYQRLSMAGRATGRDLPAVHLVDMRRAPQRGHFSARLLKAIEERLVRGEQTLLFLNRRGYARAVQCTACGEAIGCPHCAVTLTYHRVGGVGRCHCCGYQAAPSLACPACGKPSLQLMGVGTQKLEERLRGHFPDARIVRMDRDTTARRGAHGSLLERMHSREADILLGTQIVTKGHHLGGVTLVGVILADLGLQVPDFRAGERTFQLLSQVAGRCGREEPGEVILQTYQPDNPALQAVAAHDYDGFAERELETRRALHLPPFGRLVLVAAEATRETATRDHIEEVAAWWREHAGDRVRVLGPTTPMVPKVADRYRWQLLLVGPRPPLHALLHDFRATPLAAQPPRGLRLKIDVDPLQVA